MISLETFISELSEAIKQGLPGERAQFKMVPLTRAMEMARIRTEIKPKESSILILFYEKNGELYTVFMKRASYDGVHSGQISFPGGKLESSDPSLIATAFREANEEIGINTEETKHIGELTDLYIPPSNFNVLPVLAYTNNCPDFVIDRKEVERLIEVPISLLINPAIIQHKEIKTRFNKNLSVPCYFIDKEIIWGATAMIISELNDLIKRTNLKS